MTTNFTHRVIRIIPSVGNQFIPVGTLLDGSRIHHSNLVSLESLEFIVPLTEQELEELTNGETETETRAIPHASGFEVPLKKQVAKKPVAKKAPAKKAVAKKPVKKSVAK